MKMRVLHRYLGYFLAGIMAVYALSGILLIFRTTDFLKSEVVKEKEIEKGLTQEEINPELRLGSFQRNDHGVLYFEHGNYDPTSGMVKAKKMELPYLLDKMTHLHKSSTKDPLFYLNIFFGVALLFFVISAFFMYMPGTDILKKGLYFTLAGVVLTLLLLFI
ncbi:hypothetical protein CRYO30217_01275 [Parvicella tangerina]|uniref:PepSY domain-containing protein n=2 Tax=Parvicella tangerina TaxID=2829795 RepID=A0A916NA92_9FLAO|nr:hypothetical protein CRYO30217_01275 [Parvicella tangerina]